MLKKKILVQAISFIPEVGSRLKKNLTNAFCCVPTVMQKSTGEFLNPSLFVSQVTSGSKKIALVATVLLISDLARTNRFFARNVAVR
jgi:hypothetical protein